jgi:hypothetical protein
MTSSFRRLAATCLLVTLAGPALAQEQESPALVFRSSVDLVSMAAIVRDSRGKIVPSLRREDFEILDAGRSRPSSTCAPKPVPPPASRCSSTDPAA